MLVIVPRYKDSLLGVFVGKFVTVKGTVVRVSCIKPLCTTMAYECVNCRHIQVTLYNGGLLWPPCVADADIILLPCGFYLLFFLA